MTDAADPPRFAKDVFRSEHAGWTKHQIDEVWMSLRGSKSPGARQQIAYYEKKLKEMVADFDARHPGERERREKEKQMKEEKKEKRKEERKKKREATEGELKPKIPKKQKVASSSSATDSEEVKPTESLEGELDASLASFKKVKSLVSDQAVMHRYVVVELTKALKESSASNAELVVPDHFGNLVPKTAVMIRCSEDGDRILFRSMCGKVAGTRGLHVVTSASDRTAYFWVRE